MEAAGITRLAVARRGSGKTLVESAEGLNSVLGSFWARTFAADRVQGAVYRADPGLPDRPSAHVCHARVEITRTQHHVSPGRERRFCPHLVSRTAPMPPTSRSSTPATSTIPASVDAEWQAFFESLKDSPADVAEERRRRRPGAAPTGRCTPTRRTDLGARRQLGARSRRPSATKLAAKAQANGVELAPADVQQATRDSVRALMLIRAYRMRGHLHANLDPLGHRAARRITRSSTRAPTASPKPISTARSSSTTCSASNTATLRQILAILRAHLLPDARRRVHAHLQPGAEGAGSRSASKARTRKSASPARASARSSTS